MLTAAEILRLMALELEKVDSLISLVGEAAESEIDRLGGFTDDGLDDFAEEALELADLAALFSQLRAVALYSVVEIRTKSALTGVTSAEELGGAFRIKTVQRLFRRYTTQELASLPHYSAIDELRCLNNSFKHDGLVGAELAAFPGWTARQPLRNVGAAIRRIRPLVPDYLTQVVTALRP